MHVFHGVLAGILQVYNLYAAHCIATGTLFTECGSVFLAGHYWSLSLEEQFYIFLPLIFVVVPSRQFMKFIVVAIALLFFWDRPVLSYGWYFRVDGFLWGVLISLFAHEFPKRYLSIRPAFLDNSLARISCALILILLLGLSATLPFFSSVAVIAVVCAVLVWLASYSKGYIFGNARYSDTMVAIGARSYSLYVIHLPIFFLTSSTIGKFAATQFSTTAANIFSCLLALSLMIFLTELNYRYIEMPIRDRGRKMAKQLTDAKSNP
jgi:peptidoglycan/LPS O-acetylase OafA/YrhL